MSFSHYSRPLHLLLLLIVCFRSVLCYKFKLALTGENDLIHSDMFQHIRSSIQCGALCAERRGDDGVHPLCEAYRYRIDSGGCRLYVTQAGGTDAMGVPVYRYAIEDDVVSTTPLPSTTSDDPFGDFVIITLFHPTTSITIEDEFEILTHNDQTYNYHISSFVMTYQTAKDHCQLKGGYLVHFDSSNEFDAFKEFIRGIPGYEVRAWVGASDILSEGQWVDERDKLPLDFSIWKFSVGEPNDYRNDEDCASYNSRFLELNDRNCFSDPARAFCEQTL